MLHLVVGPRQHAGVAEDHLAMCAARHLQGIQRHRKGSHGCAIEIQMSVCPVGLNPVGAKDAGIQIEERRCRRRVCYAIAGLQPNSSLGKLQFQIVPTVIRSSQNEPAPRVIALVWTASLRRGHNSQS